MLIEIWAIFVFFLYRKIKQCKNRLENNMFLKNQCERKIDIFWLKLMKIFFRSWITEVYEVFF